MGRGGTAVAALLAGVLVSCGSLAGVGSAPETLAPTPLPTPAPTSGTTRPEITIRPFDGQRIFVRVDGPDSQTVSATIYRDGVQFAPRTTAQNPSGLSSSWGVGAAPGQSLEGHTFVFLFQRADDSEYGRATISVPASSAVVPGSASPRPSIPSPRPTLPPEPASTPTPPPTGPSTRGTVYVQPIVPGIAVIDVWLVGKPGDVVSVAIYRDGVLRGPRSAGMVLTVDGWHVGWDGSQALAHERMEGHLFRFDFIAEDGSLYASASVLYPLPPGATIAPDATPFIARTPPPPTQAPPPPTVAPIAPGTPMRGTVTVLPIVPDVARITVMLKGTPGDVVTWTAYRDGVLGTPRSATSTLTADGFYVGWDGTHATDRMEGHVFRFDFFAEDGSLYASASVLYPLTPSGTIAPDPASSSPPPTAKPTAAPTVQPAPGSSTPAPTTGTSSSAIRIEPRAVGSFTQVISVFGTDSVPLYCTLYRDTVAISGPIPLAMAHGVGGCAVDYGAQPDTIRGHSVLFIITRADGSEFARATVYFPTSP